MYRMIISRLLLVLILAVAFVGFVPPQEGDTSLLGKIQGFLLPSKENGTIVPAANASQEAKKEENVAVQNQAPSAREPVFHFNERKQGSDFAPLKLKLFSSLTCVHCAHFATGMLPALDEKYVQTGKMQIIYFDFPLEERAMVASLISKCLPDDRYFPFMNALYEAQMKWMMSHNLQNALEPYARMAGLSKEKMIACATNAEALKKLNNQKQIYASKYQINATPMLILETKERIKTISGAPSDKEEFFSILDSLLQETGGKENPSEKTAVQAP